MIANQIIKPKSGLPNYFILFSLILTFYLSPSVAAEKVIIKANILSSENFVTNNIAPKVIEDIISDGFTRNDFEVLARIKKETDVLYVDVFLFQFPGDYPSIALTIRSSQGVHYVDNESIKFFGNRSSANLKITKKIAERLPKSIDKKHFTDLKLRSIINGKRISLVGVSSNMIIKSYQDKYSIKIEKGENENLPFIFSNETNEYLAYCIDFQGLRGKLKGNSLIVNLKFNDKASLEIINIDSPFILSEKQHKKIIQMINKFPLWISNSQLKNIQFVLGLK